MTRRQSNHPPSTHPYVAKMCIWSVAHQKWMAGQIRIYIGCATAVVAFFTLAGLIDLKTALLSVFLSGVSVAIFIWLLIQQRRYWLLNIQEPRLRQEALAAMVTYLSEIKHPIPLEPQSRAISGNQSDAPTDCHHVP